MRNIIENFQEGNEGFWSHLIFINFEQKFKSHGVEDSGFEAVNF